MNGSAGGAPGAAAAPPLAILCGSGAFPLEVAAEARRAGREPFLIGVVGSTDAAIEAFPHVWLRMGEVGKLFAALKERAIGEMVMIGAMTRPEFADLRLDWGAVKRAAELAQLFRRGDNGLLVGLAAIFEREGVRIVGAHEVAPRLAAPVGPPRRAPGLAGGPSPTSRLGARLLEALSGFDAGQGAVVAAGRVLAIEAAEGTDAMLARVAELRVERPPAAQGAGRRAGEGAEAGAGSAPRHARGRPADDRGRGKGAIARRRARRRAGARRRARALRARSRRRGAVRLSVSRRERRPLRVRCGSRSSPASIRATSSASS